MNQKHSRPSGDLCAGELLNPDAGSERSVPVLDEALRRALDGLALENGFTLKAAVETYRHVVRARHKG